MAEDTAQTVEAEETDRDTIEGAEHTDTLQEQRIARLETALAEREARIRAINETLVQREERIAEVEEALGQRESRIQELEAALGQAEVAMKERAEEMEGLKALLNQAVALYRSSLLAAEPEIPQDMVQGDTVEEIETSLAQARQMVERVRGQMETQAAQERVPFGAPARSAPDLSNLSSQEKILLGLSRR